ncbi:MAG: DUF3040 domain-containing protein [Nocardioides sp.]
MPLSEEENRLLEQMERALVEEDPKFASTLRGTTQEKIAKRNALLASLGLVAGIGVLMTGAVSRSTPIGIAGFVTMLLSATVAISALRGRSQLGEGRKVSHPSGDFQVIEGGRSRARGRSRAPKTRGSSSLSARMEERWRRRRDQNDRDY